MKAVAADPFGVEAFRDRVMIGDGTVAAVEGGIEAGDLRQVRKAGEKDADRRQVVGLVQRRQRHVTFEIGEHVAIDPDRPVILRAAMYDTVTDCRGHKFLRLAQPSAGAEQCRRNIADLRRRVGLVDQELRIGTFGAQLRPRADAVHLPFDQAAQPAVAVRREHLELDTRRAGIDDQDRVHGSHAAGKAVPRRRASA